jgi:predicted GNAT superfamily acetyltransferase
LFSAAHLVGHTIVCCEVNAEPPNPASDAFHEAMEFSVIGAATLDDGAKTVRYFARQLV